MAHPRALNAAYFVDALGMLKRYAYPLRSLVWRDLRERYAGTVLGIGWAVLHPVLLLLLYTVVFAYILKLRFSPDGGAADYALYLLCGLVPYMALSEGIQRGSVSLMSNAALLNKVVFPATVLPAVGVFSGIIAEAVGLLVLGVLVLAVGPGFSPWILLLPLLVFLRALLTLGLAWLVAVLNVFFRDLGQIIGLALTALLFTTPILYPMDLVPERLQWLLDINPLHHVVAGYRAVILQGEPPVGHMVHLAGWAFACALFGLWFFRQTVQRAKDFL